MAITGLWNEEWAQFAGHTWTDVPWYFAETFFYRRLMEAVRFYQPGPWYDVDPFALQKAADLEKALPTFLAVAELAWDARQATFTTMLHDSLWGNRADLSNRTVTETARAGLSGQQAHRLLIDDTARIWAYLHNAPPGRVDVITDNSGLELLLDLRLADFLVREGLAAEVRFHLKRMPFFVSDAMIRDLYHTLERLADHEPHGAALAARLRQFMAQGHITLHDDPFWSTCFSYHQIPTALRRELAESRLLLFKGDVNYRRLLDDRHWPPTARMADIAAGLPAPFVALRTLKGELIVDLPPGQAEELAAADPTWMINGKRGIIQFIRPGT